MIHFTDTQNSSRYFDHCDDTKCRDTYLKLGPANQSKQHTPSLQEEKQRNEHRHYNKMQMEVRLLSNWNRNHNANYSSHRVKFNTIKTKLAIHYAHQSQKVNNHAKANCSKIFKHMGNQFQLFSTRTHGTQKP